MTVYGWDASDFDWSRGPMDVAAAAKAGIQFFTHKATEATSTQHRRYGEAMRRARDAGIPILGAYHVVRSPANAAAEVDYCLAYANAQTPWWKDHPGWFWQVDLERWPYDSVPASEGEQFADIIEARTGRRAVIYASKGQYGDGLRGTSHPLWNANYGGNSAGDFKSVYAARGGDSGPGWTTYSGRMPAIWQYGSNTRIGSQPTCDANAYRGTLNELRTLITGTKPTPSLEPDMPSYGKTATDSTVWVSDGMTRRPMSRSTAWSSLTAVGAKLATFASEADLTDALGPVATSQPELDYDRLAEALLRRIAVSQG